MNKFNFENFKSFREGAALNLSVAKMTELSDRVIGCIPLPRIL